MQYPHEDDYNCCVSCIIRTFKKMYPSHPKIAYTIQGQKLRSKEKLFTFLNIVGCVLSLAFLGFGPMADCAMLLAFSYSAYLTLREWVIVLHICLTFCSVFQTLNTLAAVSHMNQQFICFIIIGFFLYQGFFVSRYYFKFRKFGGIKGRRDKKNKESTAVNE